MRRASRILVLGLAMLGALAIGAEGRADRPARSGAPASPVADDKRFFVIANAVFTLYHELGHALIDEFSIPVLGREEDAVDRLAVLLMIPAHDEPAGDEVQMLLVAADGWVASWNESRRDAVEIDFWGQHSLDIQRGLSVLCLLYGSDPDGLAGLSRDMDLDPERAALCVEEFAQTAESWSKLLDAHFTPDGTRTPTGGRLRVLWDFDADAVGAREAGWLREDGMVEEIAGDFANGFRLPRDLTIVVTACDGPDAWWDPEAGEIVLCTDLLAEFGRFATLN